MKKVIKHTSILFLLLIVITSFTGCFTNNSNGDIVGNYYVTHINLNGFETSLNETRIMSFDEEKNYYVYEFDSVWTIVDSGTYSVSKDVLTITDSDDSVSIFSVETENGVTTLTLTNSDNDLLTTYITSLEKIEGNNPATL